MIVLKKYTARFLQAAFVLVTLVLPTGALAQETRELEVGSYIVEWSAMDAAGNTRKVHQRVVVQDTTPPQIVLNDPATVEVEVGSTYTELVSATDLVDDDVVLSGTIQIDGDVVDTSTIGSYTVTYDVTDAAGNEAQQKSRTVNVVPFNDPPSLALVGASTLILEVGDSYVDPGILATDTEDDDIVLTGQVQIDFSAVNTGAPGGPFLVTYNVTDSGGKAAPTITRTVNVIPFNNPPSLALTGDDPLVLEVGDTYVDPGILATDTEDDDTVLTGQVQIDFSAVNTSAPGGPFLVTYNVTDSGGKAAPTITRTVNVVPFNDPPSLALVGADPLVLEVGATYVEPGILATDTEDDDVVLTGQVQIDSSTVNTSVPGGPFLVTYNVTDSGGKAAPTITRTVTVVAFNDPPAIALNGDNPLNWEVKTAYVDPGASATDTEDDDLVLTGLIDVDFSAVITTVPGGPFLVTYDVTDSDGKAAPTQTRIVYVVDSTPPDIEILAGPLGGDIVNLNLDDPYGVTEDPGANATDNLDDEVDITARITVEGLPVDTSTLGDKEVKYNVSDDAGNPAATAIRIVRVTDNVKPVIELAGPSMFNIHIGETFIDPVIATDNIDGDITGDIQVTVTGDPIDNTVIGGPFDLTYNVTDAAGNMADPKTRQVFVVEANTLLAESPEIRYSDPDEPDLLNKANELASPVLIYEYVRNNYEYSVYHGSRSGSTNTFLDQRGNDVDLASTLIAMLRSQKIPARYVVGNIKMDINDLMNWMNVKDPDLAVSIMRDQGIQGPGTTPGNMGPELSADGSTVTFEHVWVEAMVGIYDYRGAGTDSVTTCSGFNPPSTCYWVGLDPSFKLKTYHNQNIDITSAVSFDYNKLYNAIRDNDPQYLDLNPLDIYKGLILDHLNANEPGKTLEDVKDHGTIIREERGLIPTSLPFEVVDNVRRYETPFEHDTAATTANTAGFKKWQKSLVMQTKIVVGPITFIAGAGNVLLVDASTKRLTITLEVGDLDADPVIPSQVVVRLDGEIIATPITLGGLIGGTAFDLGDPFSVEVNLDGPPAVEAGEPDDVITVNYENLVAGGYYLVSNGGNSSNWSQVHRASKQLLAANDQYPIVNDGNGVPHVDENQDGIIDPTELPLLEHKDALDAMTGGLLYVAATQYYARFHETLDELNDLNHAVSPIRGFIGVVSSTHEVEYLDGTAFAVMPGGLLIDMKGIAFNGFWENDAPDNFSNEFFNLAGHIGSALEHEIWQELTGFDAVSTVRGIQMAMAQDLDTNGSPDAVLLEIKNDGTTDTLPAAYPHLGFNSTAPSPFIIQPRIVFSDLPTSWFGAPGGFETFKGTISAADSALAQAKFTYNYNNLVNHFYGCVDGKEEFLQGHIDDLGAGFSAFITMGGCFLISDPDSTENPPPLIPEPLIIDPATAITLGAGMALLQTYYDDRAAGTVPPHFNPLFLDYFNRNLDFDPAQQVYRSTTLATDDHDTSLILGIRSNNYFPPTNTRVEYVIPSRLTVGSNFRFSVYIQKVFDTTTETLASLGFIISNKGVTGSGGYLDFSSIDDE